MPRVLLATLTLFAWAHHVRSEIDFDRTVRPILSDHCYPCHGPDAAARVSDLRFDRQESVFADLGGYAAITPEDPASSEALRRVESTDPDEQMPPPDAKLDLTDTQRAALRAWIEQGAEWSEHWAFERPSNSPRTNDNRAASGIDPFVSTRLREANLAPAPPADKPTLLRRVTFDLTGLPPTLEEIDAFVADDSPEAYERVVDRLLGSVEHAERLANEWLDVARYADSHGLHADGLRTSWPWRDWVIKAFRENMPYDRFVTWQLAGDLLPEATRQQRLATAFLRNHPMTGEGGVIDEEFRWNYVFDRTETYATAVLGLTMQCCRCHDHKFDPISQEEYYRLAACFNDLRELGMTGDDGDYGPLLTLYDEPSESRVEALRNAIARIDAEIAAAPQPPPEGAGSSAPEPSLRLRLDGTDNQIPNWKQPKQLVDGIDGAGAAINGEYGYLEIENAGLVDVAAPLSGAAWVRTKPPAEGATPKSRMLMGNAGDKNLLWRGWEFLIDLDGRLELTLTSGRPADRIAVRTEASLTEGEWTHLAFAYDGAGDASGVRLYLNGQRQAVEEVDNGLRNSIHPVTHDPGFPLDKERKLRVARSYRKYLGDDGILVGELDDVRLYDAGLTDVEVAQLFDGYGATHVAPLVTPQLTDEQHANHAVRRSGERQRLDEQRRALLAMLVELNTAATKVMIAAAMDTPRETHVLDRGLYDQPRQRVATGVPVVLGELPDGAPTDRLALARWSFGSDNPLAARVAVNRYWQMLFGAGLVLTPHDFGVQGDRPSHLKLLDHLATEFRASGWDLRALLRSIVTSSTYQQSSSPAAWQAANPGARADPLVVDPGNRLLWRAPSRRLSAEAVRDAALAASDLLVKTVGGPSAKPYQPPGLWSEKSSFSQALLEYTPDTGDGLYRRSMYTFVRRTSPHPAMTAFDAPNRSECTVRREATNTPMQALVLMNDTQFVEAARVVAARVVQSGGEVPSDERIAALFRRLTGRAPTEQEAEPLVALYSAALGRYSDDPAAAAALLSTGESECELEDEQLRAQAAALAVVSQTIMSYDAFYMLR